jgi:hypothetical protein
MWRACFAVIHIDKIVTPEERSWAEDKIAKLPLTEDQRNILKADLENGLEFEEAFTKISDKVDLAFLLNTLRVIGFLDHDFSSPEKEAYNKLEAIIMKGINLQEIEAEINQIRLNTFGKDEMYENANTASYFELIHHAFLKFIK